MVFGLVASGALLCVGCGDDGAGEGGGTSTSSAASTAVSTASSAATTSASSSSGGPITDDFVAGGDRPVTVKVPSSYDPSTPTPLLILLHGYTATGMLQDLYFGMTAVAEAEGLIYAHPDGTVDQTDNQFWNATDACCDFYGTDVDDVAYLTGLVDEIVSKVNVDPKRIYFVGHSNGGFMSYRMACEASERIAAIVSLAGANWLDGADCGATSPVSVAQIHGDMDDTILYGGGMNINAYPSAAESTAYFAGVDGCDAMLASGGPNIDLESTLAGNETTVEVYPNCHAGHTVELWTIVGGGHVPNLSPAFSQQVVDFLLAHPKP
jgi:polyhydroxybutyrate depolymerase